MSLLDGCGNLPVWSVYTICSGSVVAMKHACVRLRSVGVDGNWSSSSFLDVVFVLLVFLRCASRCPMAVASMDGGKQLRDVSERPTNGGRKFFASALFNVEIDGENRAACAKATKSAWVLLLRLMAGAAMAFVVGLVVGL